ncbi:hypothetical protein SprV_0501890800 [Sparganum proliferum]
MTGSCRNPKRQAIKALVSAIVSLFSRSNWHEERGREVAVLLPTSHEATPDAVRTYAPLATSDQVNNKCYESLHALVASVPKDLAVETIELLLREKYGETENRLGHAQISQLLKFCLKTYFTFDGTIYEQVKGPPMGSPISGFIVDPITVGVAGPPTPQTEILDFVYG